MNAVWFVQWPIGYEDLCGAFSTREKAVAYIESEAERLHLNEYGFTSVGQGGGPKGAPTWGIYKFTSACGDTQTVFYQKYDIDVY